VLELGLIQVLQKQAEVRGKHSQLGEQDWEQWHFPLPLLDFRLVLDGFLVVCSVPLEEELLQQPT
jgi:hypothetical protein